MKDIRAAINVIRIQFSEINYKDQQDCLRKNVLKEFLRDLI